MTLLFNEDEALKTFLSGITVSDDKNATRPVQVWFGQPDLEVRAQSYPYLTIDLIDITMDRQRVMHGIDSLPYVPDGITGWPNPVDEPSEAVVTESPVPLALTYQVTSYARHPRHDRAIVVAMLQKFPFQFGAIEVEQDNTVRRAYLNRYATKDSTDSDKKRLFSKAFDIVVEAELLAHKLYILPQVAESNLTLQPSINIDVPTDI